jgi:V8-like Glu-specific endopeptidase
MPLNTMEFNQVFESLRAAYNVAGLRQMLRTRLGKRLDEISLAGDFRQIVFELLEAAEREGYTQQLVVAARQSNPDNEQLLAAAQTLGLAVSNSALEKKVRELPFVDIAQWRAKLGAIETQVCRVETPGGYGTGFLVSPRTVLTNYHVVEEVIKGMAKPSSVVLRFDYKRSTDGTTLHPGTEFRLVAKDWLADSSPYSKADDVDDPALTPGAEELDYALLRIEGDPGSHPVSASTAEPGAPARGFIKVPTVAVDLRADEPLLIVQHPKGAPLKLAFDTLSITTVNGNRTRVRYRTNTEGGSSGSPAFDANWNLIALHHAGDPDAKPATLARWNQGIPIDAVRALITKRGLAGELALDMPAPETTEAVPDAGGPNSPSTQHDQFGVPKRHPQ